jgi:hypothetical protein
MASSGDKLGELPGFGVSSRELYIAKGKDAINVDYFARGSGLVFRVFRPLILVGLLSAFFMFSL